MLFSLVVYRVGSINVTWRILSDLSSIRDLINLTVRRNSHLLGSIHTVGNSLPKMNSDICYIAFAKKPFVSDISFPFAIAKCELCLKAHLRWVKVNARTFFLWINDPLWLLSVDIKLDSLWTHLKAMSLSLLLSQQFKWTLTASCGKRSASGMKQWQKFHNCLQLLAVDFILPQRTFRYFHYGLTTVSDPWFKETFSS